MPPHLSPGLLTGLASTTAVAPVLFLVPGVQEKLSMQAAKWGPRWERGFARAEPHFAKHLMKVEPPARRASKAVEPKMKSAAT